MKRRNIGIIIILLILSITLTSCSSKSKTNAEEEQEMEEELIEERIEKTMEEFNNIVESKEGDISIIVDFIDINIKDVGKDNGDRMIGTLEGILEENSKEVKKKLDELDTNNEIRKLIKEEIFLQEGKIKEIKNKELKSYFEKLSKKPYKIACEGNEIRVLIDYDEMLKYSNHINEKWESYLSLMANEFNDPIVWDQKILVEYDEISKRLLKLEDFLVKPENNIKYEEVLGIYRKNLIVYLKGTLKTSIVLDESNDINPDLLESYGNLAKNKDDATSYAIRRYTDILKENDNKLYDGIDKDILSVVNQSLSQIEESKTLNN